MAEISSLLGLITDDQTRQALIAQMENMFDNAPDEERLIQEIGNPTKVAVALIRYADSGKITPAAAPVVAPEQVQPRRAPQPRPRAEQYRPIAPQPAPQPAYADQAAEDTCDEQPAAPVLDGQFSFDEQPEEGYYDEQPADDGYYDEQPEGGYDPNYATDGEEGYYDEAYYDEPAYKTNVFLAILYTLGAIIIGVPVLAVLLVLTFFSKTIMNASLPEVATQQVSSGAINARIRGQGTVEASEVYNVTIKQTRKVSSVLVKTCLLYTSPSPRDA